MMIERGMFQEGARVSNSHGRRMSVVGKRRALITDLGRVGLPYSNLHGTLTTLIYRAYHAGYWYEYNSSLS